MVPFCTREIVCFVCIFRDQLTSLHVQPSHVILTFHCHARDAACVISFPVPAHFHAPWVNAIVFQNAIFAHAIVTLGAGTLNTLASGAYR